MHFSYITTLGKRDEIQDPEERANILKACHKRCAERTLKVLEKNGGIFIKLGQHLVSLTLPGPVSKIESADSWTIFRVQ